MNASVTDRLQRLASNLRSTPTLRVEQARMEAERTNA
jgi:predicted transcriptional regulator